jgi:hypothetical protein
MSQIVHFELHYVFLAICVGRDSFKANFNPLDGL